MDSLSLFAPAKINLTLEVLGKGAHGYHALESLVAFASFGDVLHFEKAGETSLILSGPFGSKLLGEADNLILNAHRELEEMSGQRLNVAINLDKNLPIASGVGGGSADAACCLRGLTRLFGLDPRLMQAIAPKLGADVPVCLDAGPKWMTGIGHQVVALEEIAQADIIAINPGFSLSTRDVFRKLDASSFEGPHAPPPSNVSDFDGLHDFMARYGNDLTLPACALNEEIEVVLAKLNDYGQAFMSGSGATCCVLVAAGQGQSILSRMQFPPHYWTASGALICTADAKIDEIE